MALSFASATIAKEGEYTASVSRSQSSGETYSSEEIIEKSHNFFGKTTRGVAEAIEYVFSSKGEPTAYIVGEEAAGAVVAGLRYGEGTIYYKNGMKERIFWQGPSVGFDFGGNGSRALVLVYNSTNPSELHDGRFGGVEGSAYLVGGLGVNFEQCWRHHPGAHPHRRGRQAGCQCRLPEIHPATDLEPLLRAS